MMNANQIWTKNEELFSVNDPLNTIQFSDIFNIEEIQRLQDLFSEANGVASVITTIDGEPITRPSNFTRLCSNIIRKTEKGLANCYKSDAVIGIKNSSGPTVQPCMSCGLWDAGSSITVGGKHIANWLIGQVLNDNLNEQRMMQYADEIGANRIDFLQALHEVPIMSAEKFNNIAKLLFTFANELSEKAYNNLLLKIQINEKEIAEKALRKSEEKWRKLFEILPVGVSILDEKGNISEYNPALEKILELPEDSLRNGVNKQLKYLHTDNTEIDPEDFPGRMAVKEQRVIRNIEVGVEKEDGKLIWTEVCAAPLSLPDAICAIVTSDITERKQMENELKRSELLLSITQQLTHVGGWAWDVEKQLMYWTKEMYNIHDLDQDKYVSGATELLNLHMECFLPEDRPKIREAFQQCIGEGRPYDLEFHFTTLKGRSLWIRTMTKPVFKNGKVVSLTGFIMDITERKLFEIELMEREINYSELFDTVQQAIYIQKPDSTFITVNQGAVDMYGYEKEYFIGKTPEFLSDPEKNDLNQISGFMNLAYQGRPQKFEFWGKKKNGVVFPKEIWTVKGKYYGQDVLISLAIDITERKRAEAEIHLKNEELLKINAEKDKFFSIIAHDLRSPFSGFLGLTELMAEGWTEMSIEEFHNMVLMMKNSATNLFSLLGNLLDWSRMQRGLATFVPASILLMPKIAECLVMTQETACKKEIAINYDVPEDLAVFADGNMFDSIMRNLVSNAVKFTPKGGSITISAKPATGNFVEISVTDTGIGMNREMIDNLCRLDVNTKRKGTEGEYSTGLGLIICRDLIEKHGGKMWVESEVGKGSTFRFILPSD